MTAKSKAEQYRHGGRRSNNPTQETVATAGPGRRQPKEHRKDGRNADAAEPTLKWRRGSQRKTATAPLLMRTEQVDPQVWLHSLKKRNGVQGDLFGTFNDYGTEADRAALEWYEHAGNWSNRLIHADARRAMASLLEHEHLGGAVQMIYFDPPYGMDFDAKYANDTTARRAFADSYRRGIHSYLDIIRETMELARELLSESGSFFMQIGDVNTHRAALVLDEVFGPENRVSTITYATTGGGSSTKSIPKATDYILWYARDREWMLYQPLYEVQSVKEWLESDPRRFNTGGDFSDGSSRPLSAAERRNPESLPAGTRLWRMVSLTSQGPLDGEQGRPFVYHGVQYGPDGLAKRHWSVDHAGLQALADAGRLWSNVDPGTPRASSDQLRLKHYFDETPGDRITNLWPEQIRERDKRYVVQTGRKAIERCALMTTEPGDLVLDPTCGGATTAVVAETWGRRWIAVDSSRESISVARETVLVREYPKHLLLASADGFRKENQLRQAAGQPPLDTPPEVTDRDPAGGLVVERMPYVSAATLAYADRTDKPRKRDVISFVDRPVGSKTGRIASNFTVESEYVEEYVNPDDVLTGRQATRAGDWRERILQTLDERGIGNESDDHWVVENISALDQDDAASAKPGRISHRCTLLDVGHNRRRDALLAIWPPDGKVSDMNIHHNVAQAMGLVAGLTNPVLIVIGAEIAAGTQTAVDNETWQVPTIRIEAGAELHLGDTKRTKGKDTPLTLVAEPTVEVQDADGDEVTVTVHGWHQFNPVTGEADFVPAAEKNVRMWLLDTDYDGLVFCARRIHLSPKLRGDENRKVLRGVLRANGDPEAVDTVFGYQSRPFPRPQSGAIAVRLVLDGGYVLAAREPVPASTIT